jgi:hypothetical protein
MISVNIFASEDVSTILELYSEIALFWKLFGVGHMYINTFLFRMTDTVTSHNIDLSSKETLSMGNIFCHMTSFVRTNGCLQ